MVVFLIISLISPNYIYTLPVKLFTGGEWQVVWIDDRIPVRTNSSTADGGTAHSFRYSHSRAEGESWVWLLEKAMVSLNVPPVLLPMREAEAGKWKDIPAHIHVWRALDVN